MQGSERTTRGVYESFKQVQYTVETLMSKPVQIHDFFKSTIFCKYEIPDKF